MASRSTDQAGVPGTCVAGSVARRFDNVSILIPVYNSEKTIGSLIDVLAETLGPEYANLQVILVNDGSRDRSHAVIVEAMRRHPGLITYVNLTRNFGEHNAVMCGLRFVAGDCVVIMDDDFQNPPGEVKQLIARLEQGFDVVYSSYEQKQHSRWRNLGSRFNDWVATRVLGKPKDLYLSSFKAMRAMIVDLVTQYDGPFPYLDSLIMKYTSSIGTQQTAHARRVEGSSNYNLYRLARLWANMLTTTSIWPLRLVSFSGLLMALGGFALGTLFIASHYVGGIFQKQTIPPGWASLIVCVTFFAGVQLLVLGVIGEYLGRLYILQNNVPQFAIREVRGARAIRRHAIPSEGVHEARAA